MRIVSLTYVNAAEISDPVEWINRLYAFTGVWEELAKQHTVCSIEQLNYEGECMHETIQYYFRNYGKGVNRFPFRLHRLVKQLRPDLVVVRGLHFPLQVIQLRLVVGKKVKIICEHHADKPSAGWRKLLNRIAGSCISAYHFTSGGHATAWLASGNIATAAKCREIPAGSTRFAGYDKMQSRKQLGWREGLHFIWTGRLDANKDPFTVLHAFARFLLVDPSATLHMSYLDAPLLNDVQRLLAADALLQRSVLLHGKIEHAALEQWYSAADFYISASYYEGGSIALVEAMACGCIPIVSAIPASLSTTGNGSIGFVFAPGDVDALCRQLLQACTVNIAAFSKQVKEYFKEELSFEAIAEKFMLSV